MARSLRHQFQEQFSSSQTGLLPNIAFLPTPPFIAEVPPLLPSIHLGPRAFFSTTNP